MKRIGIDVGGTNTDAALLDGMTVLAAVKRPTTSDVTSGIVAALSALEEAAEHGTTGVEAVMIGTTHFTNAIIEASDRLTPTGCLRLGLPATRATPPFLDWPQRLRQAMRGQGRIVHGGHEFDGRDIAPLDFAEIKQALSEMDDDGIRSIAVTSVFSPVDPNDELRVAAFIRDNFGEMRVSMSHEIGRISLLERENATIINASLSELAETTIDAFHTALAEAGLGGVAVWLSQNDGTLMDADAARHYPVRTFASGPTNSMRGAAWLSGLDRCAVVDIGGTTADIGIIDGGFPRPAGAEVEFGGVVTNFRMPDVTPLGIGGGSRLRGGDGVITVGPDSVGHELTSEGLIFGGSTLTASDLAVAAGLAEFGDPGKVYHLDAGLVRDGLSYIAGAIADGVERMRDNPDPLPVVLVGGGAAIVGGSLPGFDAVIRPEHASVANAVGAAIAQVGAEVDNIYPLGEFTRDDILRRVEAEATQKCIAAGAKPGTVTPVEVFDTPVSYMSEDALQVLFRVVGDLAMKGRHDADDH